MNGVLVIDKPKGYTSRDIVNLVSKQVKTKKVGHTGTLDPLATGVLVLCIGNYTKLVESITSLDKEYIATIQFGIATDTLDITGKILALNQQVPTKEEFEKVLSQFLGVQEQQVPIYSAKKVNGKKLYEYAREGVEVSLPSQMIEIYDLKLLSFQENQAVISCHVSKGTYIRSLIFDICKSLDVLGTMSSLKRTKQGNFSLDKSYSLEEIMEGHFEFLNYSSLFSYEVYELSKREYDLALHGNTLDLSFSSKYVLGCYQNREVAFYQKKGNRYYPLLQFDRDQKNN